MPSRGRRPLVRPELTRRRFLGATAAAAFLAACSRGGGSDSASPSPPPRLENDPFTLGVASGDPSSDSVVLWTRLAPVPIEGGGMPAEDVEVGWEIATDDAMGDIAASGVALAVPELGHSLHVDAGGLDPDRPYWYRFFTGDWETPVARTRTMPAPDASPEHLRFGHVSCQNYDAAFYAAYADLAAHGPDLIVHCGDYIYERPSTEAGEGFEELVVRDDPVPEAFDLGAYRNRYALYKGDSNLQAAHAVAPWLVTWDDHEVENNYTADSPEADSETADRESFLERRAAAYQAWWEHIPVRMEAPDGPDLAIYRRASFGDLVRFLVLDTRQYRTPQECGNPDAPIGDVGPRCDAAFAPETTVLGVDQEAWVADELGGSSAVWNVLAQQIVVQQWRFAPGNAAWNLDQWDGYPAARDRLLSTLADSDATNPVVLTGDVHSSWVGGLTEDFDDPDAVALGTEFVAPGISSDNGAVNIAVDVVPGNSPHVAWAEAMHRGWVLHDVNRDAWNTEYRFVDDATVEDSSVSTGSTWTLPTGHGAVPTRT